MKKFGLPLPIMILILATLFLFSSAFGEWIGGSSSSALRPSPSETVEQQQAAILYLRVMSWVSRVINRPETRSEDQECAETTRPVDLHKTSPDKSFLCKIQLCALNKTLHAFRNAHKSWRGAL